MDGYELLLNAVVERAVDDYRESCRRLKSRKLHPWKRNYYAWLKSDTEDFFKNGRVTAFTTVDGHYILNKLEEEQHEKVT